MKAIAKGPEPASLTAHRQTPHGNYDNYAAKDHLRSALVAEQRGLCCYCMGRIRPGASVNEDRALEEPNTLPQRTT